MRVPTWKVTFYAPMYQRAPGPLKSMVVRAHTGAEAEAIALERYPKWRVLRTERLTGYHTKEKVE